SKSVYYCSTMLFIKRAATGLHLINRRRREYFFGRSADGDLTAFADKTCARVDQQHGHSPQLGGVIISRVSGAIMVRHLVAQEQIRRRNGFEISQFVNDF